MCALAADIVAVRDGALFGESSSMIVLDDVVCQGNEANLLLCTHSSEHDCTPSEAAGVICGGKLRNWQSADILASSLCV